MLDPARPHPGVPGAACITTCAASTRPGCSGSTRSSSTRGAPALGERALTTVRGLAEVRAAAAAHLSPAGQVQVATALEMMTVLEGLLHELRHQLLDAA